MRSRRFLMQSIESASSLASPDCLTFADVDSELFLSKGEKSEVSGVPGRSALSSCSSGLGWSSTESEQEKENEALGGTPGDLQFAQKCLELQGFIRPLLELLNGLKKGRFDKGLSSFQQSVAMDRIQRIVGLLQKPHIGEKYLPTLLQVEMMLKLWFPHLSRHTRGTCASTRRSAASSSGSGITPPHKQQDQLHIPVKKRRLNWSDPCSSPSPSLAPVPCKCFLTDGQEKTQQSHASSPRSLPAEGGIGEEKSGAQDLLRAKPNPTRIHIAPILSPPESCPSLTVPEGGAKEARNDPFLPTPRPPATQDNSITSTTPCSETPQIHTSPAASHQQIT